MCEMCITLTFSHAAQPAERGIKRRNGVVATLDHQPNQAMMRPSLLLLADRMEGRWRPRCNVWPDMNGAVVPELLRSTRRTLTAKPRGVSLGRSFGSLPRELLPRWPPAAALTQRLLADDVRQCESIWGRIVAGLHRVRANDPSSSTLESLPMEPLTACRNSTDAATNQTQYLWYTWTMSGCDII